MPTLLPAVDLPITRCPSSDVTALDREGYVIVRGLLPPSLCVALREKFDQLLTAEGERAGLEVHQEEGTDRLANLVEKGEIFDALWTHPRLLGLVAQVIGRPFSLSSLNSREPKVGLGHQALHADWGEHKPDEPFHVANGLWVLDDMTADNGGTRLVPGTHRTSGPIADPHPDEIIPDLATGDLLFINAHCRHGGTINHSGRRRRVMHAYFTGHDQPQQTDFNARVSAATRARLSSAQRALLRIYGD